MTDQGYADYLISVLGEEGFEELLEQLAALEEQLENKYA